MSFHFVCLHFFIYKRRVVPTYRTRLTLGSFTFFEYLFNLYLEEREHIGWNKSWKGRLWQVYRVDCLHHSVRSRAPLCTYTHSMCKQCTTSQARVMWSPRMPPPPPHTPLSKTKLRHHVAHPPGKTVHHVAHPPGKTVHHVTNSPGKTVQAPLGSVFSPGSLSDSFFHPHILPQRSSGKYTSGKYTLRFQWRLMLNVSWRLMAWVTASQVTGQLASSAYLQGLEG